MWDVQSFYLAINTDLRDAGEPGAIELHTPAVRKKRVLIILASLAIGLACAVVITDLLDKVIWPSLFVGVPAGVTASIAAYLILRRATGANRT